MPKLTKEQLQEAFDEFAREDINGALSLSTGFFVSAMESLMRFKGLDPNQELKVNGMGNRNITLHQIHKG